VTDKSDFNMHGNWDQLKGRIKESWGVLTDDDLDRAEGKIDRLVGVIKEKTGESGDTIKQRIRKLAS